MKKVFNEFRIALLLLTAITGVVFISCNDDDAKDKIEEKETGLFKDWHNKNIIAEYSLTISFYDNEHLRGYEDANYL